MIQQLHRLITGYSHSHTNFVALGLGIYTKIYPSSAPNKSLLDYTQTTLAPLDLGIYTYTFPSSKLNRSLPDPAIP